MSFLPNIIRIIKKCPLKKYFPSGFFVIEKEKTMKKRPAH
jgi:hypothetical protein